MISLNGRPLHDILDFQFYLEPGLNQIEAVRKGDLFRASMHVGDQEATGISLDSELFDPVHRCRCRCAFCFVDQVPPGLRRALYLKDDDYRLSFLHGNFITLDNLSEADVQRIISQRLSPLYVSVHAADPEVRGLLMGTGADRSRRGLEVLKRLGERGIVTHIQIVLCPGINDGAVLAGTVASLAGDYRSVSSIGVVPVVVRQEGLPAAKGGRKPEPEHVGLRPVGSGDCRGAVGAIASWQREFRRQRGTAFVYAADEFYLHAGLPLPPPADYDDFPHFENGIGIAASFRSEAPAALAPALAGAPGGRAFLLTGVLAAELVGEVCRQLTSSLDRQVRPLAAANATFGQHVTVTGLLGGLDIAAAARREGLQGGDVLLVPRSCLDREGERFLDDMTLAGLRERLPCKLMVVSLPFSA